MKTERGIAVNNLFNDQKMFQLQRIVFAKLGKLEKKLIQTVKDKDEKRMKLAIFSYLLLAVFLSWFKQICIFIFQTGIRQGRPRLGKKSVKKDSEPYLGLVSITKEHVELDPAQ